MPQSALKPCQYPSCNNLVSRGYCAVHAGAVVPGYQRDRAKQALYSSVKWLRIRVLQLAKEPWCKECLRANIYTPASEVDHINGTPSDPVGFFNGPFQSLCKPHHSRKTFHDRKFRREGA